MYPLSLGFSVTPQGFNYSFPHVPEPFLHFWILTRELSHQCCLLIRLSHLKNFEFL